MNANSSTGRAVVLRNERTSSAELLRVEQVLSFYGLECETFNANVPAALEKSFSIIEDRRTVAVFIAQDALECIDRARFLAAVQGRACDPVRTLIFGITAENWKTLKQWTGGLVVNCDPVGSEESLSRIRVGQVGDVTGVLSGIELPAVSKPACRFELQRSDSIASVLRAECAGGTADVLARLTGAHGDVFLMPEMEVLDSSWVGKPDSLAYAFSLLAPLVLFVKEAAGEYAWQPSGLYANFTIDDPWLTEPYGHLSYKSLLGEMDQHNFHTTIAFVPWNYDRSEQGAVEIFRNHPERFSICMHGNDHIHREFGDYKKNPLPKQIANIKQGIARMERFTELTGVPADRFMVFPHGAAPEPTLTALKTYEFLGTANSLDVPLGTSFPDDPTFLLRPFTCRYAGLLSMSRYSAEADIPWTDVAIHSFLGNPLLFYGHQQLFSSGVHAFNGIADKVNELQPDTEWRSLGSIARQMYLVRKRFDGCCDVQMLSNEITLQNSASFEQRFAIEREDEFAEAASVTVDGREESLSSDRKLSVVVPSGQCGSARVAYVNDLDLKTQAIAKKNLHATMLRRVSDYRDLYLTRSRLGRLLTQKYYQNGWDSVQLILERVSVGLVSMFAAVAGGVTGKHLRGRRS